MPLRSNSSRVEIDFTSLHKPRFALVDFEPEEAAAIIAVLAEFKGLSRVFYSHLTPLTSDIDDYTAVILNLTAGLAQTSWVEDPELLASKLRLLAMGTSGEVDLFPAIQLHACETLMRPYSLADLAVRFRRCVGMFPKSNKDLGVRMPRVAIADDDPAILALVSRILRSRGFECREAKNGKQALELSREWLPDLLILDVNMPFANGFEVLSALRLDPSTSAMLILLLTAEDGQEDVIHSIKLGASAYLCKPFQPFDFVLRIKDLIPSLAETRLRHSEPAAYSGRPA